MIFLVFSDGPSSNVKYTIFSSLDGTAFVTTFFNTLTFLVKILALPLLSLTVYLTVYVPVFFKLTSLESTVIFGLGSRLSLAVKPER